VRVFGIDPGCERTGYGCVETDGSHHRIVVWGAIRSPALASFPDKLLLIHSRLTGILDECRPDSAAIVEAGVPVFEYTPAEIKRAVVGYGRAEKPQVQQMVKLLLGLAEVPSPYDAADALAVAICHVHAQRPARAVGGGTPARSKATSWRHYRPLR